MQDSLSKNDTPSTFYLSPKEAGLLVGYTPDYVAKLSREGTILAKRDGRNWLVEANSLKAFAAKVVVDEKKRLEALKEARAKEYRENREFLPLREAGTLFGYTPDYLAKLCREGTLQAERDGREWFVERASLEEFAAQAKLGKTSRIATLSKVRAHEYWGKSGNFFPVFSKNTLLRHRSLIIPTLAGLGVFLLVFFTAYGFLFSGIDFLKFARAPLPSTPTAPAAPLPTSTPVAVVTNYNTYNNTYNNTTNEYHSQTITGISSSDLAVELQGFKNSVLSQVYGAISNISLGVSGNTQAIQHTNRIDNLASVDISGSNFTGGNISNSTISNSNISGGTGSFTTLSVSGDTTLATTTIQGPFALTSTATSTFANGIDISDGCFAVDGVCISLTGGGGGSGGGTWSTTTSSVSGQLVNYSNNTTDIIAIGGTATTSAKYWFDPNAETSYLSGNVGIGTTSPFARLSLAGTAGGTTPLFALSTSTAGFATTTALTVDGNGNLSLLNGANASISGTLTLTNALGIASGGTATTTFYNGGITFYNSSLGTLSQAGDGRGLFWDETNKRLGVGTTSPYAALSVEGSSALGNSALAGYFIATTSTASIFPYASTTALTVSGNTFLTGLTGPNGLAIDANGQVYAAATSTLSTISGILPVTSGGTGWGNLQAGGILYGNGTGAVATTAQGTAGQILSWLNGIPSWTATTTFSSGLAYSAGNVTNTGLLSLQQLGGGSAQTGAITFATSSDTNLLLNITNSSGAFTFTPEWSGTLAVARGGTNASTQSTNGVNYFDGTSITSDNSKLFFNGTNFGISTTSYARLGISLGTSGTGIAADAASGYSGNLLDLKVASSTKLSVNEAGALTASSVIQSLSGIFRGDDEYHQIILHNGGNNSDYIEWGDTLANSGGHRFFTGGATPTLRLQIADDGTYIQGPVGIGTTSPYAKLSVVGQVVAANFTATTSAVNTFPYASTTALTVSGNTFLTGLTGPNGLAIDANGQVYAAATSTLSTISGILPVTSGGTGWAALQAGGILYGNGTGAVATTAQGTAGQILSWLNGIPSWTATTTFSSGLAYSAGNVTNTGLLSLQQLGGGSAQTGAITFATSSDTNLLLNITNSGGAFTFTPEWSGTLAAGRLNSNVVQGVTNDTNVTGSISAQNLTLGWTGQLGVTRGGTGLSSIASSSLLIGGPGNTFIPYATSSLGIALSDTTGTLGTSQGGTGVDASAWSGIFGINNGTVYNAATTTFSSGLAYSAGNVTNTGLLSLQQLGGGSAQTGAITFATSSTAFNGLTSNLNITNSSGAFTFDTILSGTLNNAGLTNSTVSYGGVTLSLGGSDATPAFDLTDATNLPIVGGTTGTLSIARGGTGTTTAPSGQVLYGGGAGVFQSVATTSATIGSGLTYSGTFGALLGGAGGTLSLDASGDWTGTFDGQQGTYYLDRANHTGTQLAATISDFSSTARSLFSGTFPIAYDSGTGAFAFNGLSTSSAAVVGNIPYFSGANTFANVATTSLSLSSAFSHSGTLGAFVGGAAGTLSLATNGVSLTNLAQIAANSILGNSTGATGNVTAIATSSLFAGTNGQVLARVNGTWVGVATTTAGTGLSYDGTSFNVNTSQNIATLSNLTTNGFVRTGSGNGTLSVQTDPILIAQGGTATTTFYNGGITFYNSSLGTLSQAGDGRGLFWDETNKRLGVGTTSPYAALSVEGSSALGNSALAGYFIATSTSATSTFSGGFSAGGSVFNVLQGLTKVGIGTAAPVTTLDISGTARVSSTFTISNTTSCAGSQALQTDASGNVSCGAISVTGASTGGGWTTNNVGQVTLATTSDQVGIGATTTPYAKLSILSGFTGTTTLALVPVSGQTANILDIYDTDANLSSVLTAAGNWGLGTTSPLYRLGVGGSAAIADRLTASHLNATSSLTIGSLNGFLKATAGVVGTSLIDLAADVTGILPVTSGGTGWAALQAGGIVYGNGTGAVATTAQGTAGQILSWLNGIPSWTATTTFSSGLAYSAGNVTNTGLLSLQQLGGGSAQTGAITFATSSTAFNGLTSNLNITNSGGAFTFDTILSGTLGVGGGGTGLSSIASSSLLIGGPGNTFIGYATSSLGIALSDTTGVLPISRGGTATSTFYNGGITFYNSSLGTLSQPGDGTGLFWDETNKRLGVGTAAPDSVLSVVQSSSPATAATSSNQLRLRGFRNSVGSGEAIGGIDFMSNDLSLTAPGLVAAGIQAIATADHTVAVLDTALAFFTVSGDGDVPANYGERMRISAEGNVGIGTTSPYAKLSVEGSSALGNSALAGYFVATTGTASIFPYASTTALTVSGNTFLTGLTGPNGLAIDANGQVYAAATSTLSTISGILPVTSGGTGWGALQAGGILYGNGTGAVATTAQGTAGQILSWLNGIPSWTATTTFSSGLAYSAGNVTNTGLLSLQQLGGGSAQTGAITFATSSDTNLLLNITNSSGAFTFTPEWTGTLAAGRLNSNVVQGVTNDTNVTGSISAQNLTLGWTGQLGVTRGGTGLSSIASSSLLIGGPGNTFLAYATSSLGIALSDTTGVLPINRGGTATTTFYNGGITFYNSSLGTLSQAGDGRGLFWDETNKRLGVGTTTPWAQLSLNPDGIAGPSFAVGSSSATHFVVTNGGNVGVGTAAPARLFEVSAAGVDPIVRISNDTTATYKPQIELFRSSSDRGLIQYTPGGGSSAGLIFQENRTGGDGNIIFQTAGANTRVQITGAGNVGIGTTSPYAKLSVVGQVVAANFTATTSAVNTFPYASTTALTVSGNTFLTGLTGPSGLAINANGQVYAAATSTLSTISGILPVTSGGTGWGALQAGGILYGNGTGAVATTAQGTAGQILSWLNGIPSWTATTTFSSGLAYSAGNVTNTGLLSLQQLGGGSAQTGAITFATSSTAFNGLTSNLAITNSGGAFTFAPTLSGTLGVGGGGTGATTFTDNRLLTGNGTSAINDEANLTFDGSLLTVTGNASTTQLTTTGATYLATTGGNVGIGTTTPGAKLEVAGTSGTVDIKINGHYSDGDSALLFAENNTSAIGLNYYGGSNRFDVRDVIGNFAIMSLLRTSGNVGIGTTSPYAKLSVVGQVVAANFTATTSAVNTFPYASTTALTVSGNTFLTGLTGPNGLAIDANGQVYAAATSTLSTISGILPVTSGGTGWGALQAGGILYGNGTGAVATTAQGTAGQILSWLNGIPSWTATTTFSSGLAYSAGNVTNTGLLSLQQLGGGSAQTGAITFATSSTAFNGLTSNLNITNSSGAFTFDTILSGTLNNAGLTNSTVSYGGVTLSLGGSDATPAFDLTDATSLPIVGGTTGTLSIARGGTATTTFYNGGITFYNSSLGTLSQAGDGRGLFWDETNKRLGLGTTTPWGQLAINPNALGSGVPEFVIGSSTATHFVVTGAGAVGIGTAVPSSSYKLTVAGSISMTAGSILDWASGNARIVESGYNLAFQTWTGSALTEKMKILGNGNVGLGTSTPFAKLSLALGSSGTGIALDAASGYSGNLLDFKVASTSVLTVNQAGALTSTASSPSTFPYASTTALTVSGNTFLTGLTGPNSLAIDANGQVYAAATSTLSTISGTLGIANGGTATTTFYNGGITFYNSSLGTLSQAGDGRGLFWDETNKRLGLGTTTPWGQLAINPNALGSGIPEFVIGSSTATRLIVTGGGNVGIGTTTPTERLTVDGNLKLSDNTLSPDSVTLDSETSTGLRITNPNGYVSITPLNTSGAHIYTNLPRFYFNVAPTSITGAYSAYSTADLKLQTGSGGSTRLTILATNGNTGIGTTSPYANLSVSTTAGLDSFAVGSTTGTYLKVSSLGTTTALRFDVTGTATSSFGAGINLATGCFAINNTCVGGSSFSNTIANGGTGTTTFYNGGALFYNSSLGSISQAGDGKGFFWDETNKRLGVGTSSPSAQLSVNGSGTGTGRLLTLADSANTERLVILDNGNIGQGTTTPETGLVIRNGTALSTNPHVLTFRIGASGTSAGVGIGGYTGGYGAIQGLGFTSTSGSYLLVNPAGGNVGIGTATSLGSPLNTVSISGRTAIGSGYWASAAPTNGLIVEGVTGIGTSSPYAKLSVAGGTSGVGLGIDMLSGYTGNIVELKVASTSVLVVNQVGALTSTAASASTFPYASTTALTVGGGNNALAIGTINGPLSAANGLVVATTSVGTFYGGTGTTTFYNGGVTFFNSTLGTLSQGTAQSDFFYDVSNKRLGLGTTSPWAQLSLNPNGISGPSFAIGSSSATHFVVTNGGSVGVGTAAPLSKVDVAGSVAVGSYAGVTAAPTDGLIVSGNVGIGRDTPTERLAVAVPTGSIDIASFSKTQTTNDTGALLALWGGSTGDTVRGYLGFAHTGSGADTTFTGELADALQIRSEGAFQLGAGGNNIRLTVLSGGNVGIGTTTPVSKLSVQGDGYISSGLFVGGSVVSTSSSASIFPYASTTALTVSNSAYFATAGGSVGIGTTSPWGLLSVNPNALGSGVPEFVVGSSTATRLIVTGGGNVGIGTASPSALLDVQGAAQFGSSNINLIDSVGKIAGLSSTYFNTDTSDNLATILTDETGSGGGFVRALSPTFTGTPVFSGGLISYSVNSTSTIPNNTPFAWTVATSSTAAPLLRFDTTTDAEQVIIGVANSDVYIGSTGAGSDLIFEENSTIRGVSPGRTLTIGANSDIINFGVAVGIGTTTPYGKLHVLESGMTYNSEGSAGFAIGDAATPAKMLAFGYDTSIDAGYIQSIQTGADVKKLILNAQGGNVGIGTTTPWATFAVNPIAGYASNAFVVGSSTATRFLINNAGNVGIGTTSPWGLLSVNPNALGSGVPEFVVGSSTATRLIVTGAGKVGVGTAAPTTQFQVVTSASDYDLLSWKTGSNDTWSWGSDSGGTYLRNVTDASFKLAVLDNGRIGVGTTTPWATLAVNPIAGAASNAFVVGSSTATRFLINNAGNVGIGTTSPGFLLSVSGGKVAFKSTASTTSAFVVENSYGANVLQVDTQDTANNIFSVATSSGTSYFDITRAGNVGVGTTSPASTLTVTGSACFSGGSGSTVACGTTAGSIYYRSASVGTYDFAENYPTSDPSLSAGTIASLDLTSGTTITTAVPGSIPLGIISTDPGVLLGGSDATASAAAARPVALSGRVPVKVSTANGAIAIGDRLMLSTTTPGVAVKAIHSGQTIGIALENYTSSAAGTVETFVSSQYWFAPSDLAIDSTTGTVGIGTTTPVNDENSNYRLSVGGDILATGFVNLSEGDSKEDVQHIDAAKAEDFLETIRGLMVAEYHYKNEPAEATRVGLIAEEAPAIVRSTKGNGIDLYKLLSVAIGGIQSLADKFDELASAVSSLASRVAALEGMGGGAVSGAVGNITGALESALTSQSVSIANGTVTTQVLAAHQFVATPGVDGAAAAGTAIIPAGQTSVLVQNILVAENSKVFVTFNSNPGSGWYVREKTNGGFSVSLNAPLQNDASFDYFVVDVAASTPSFSAPSPGAGAAPAGDSQAPVISMNGNNPAVIQVGDSYVDLGALVSDNVDQNLGITTLLDGVEMLNINIDTSAPRTYTVTYMATDVAGNSASVERTVIVEALPGTPPPNTAPSENDGAPLPQEEVVPPVEESAPEPTPPTSSETDI